ncbi:MAG: hypothetical protein RL367_1908 [Pseudomonadota bacterium]|jgi:hypothetical protein
MQPDLSRKFDLALDALFGSTRWAMLLAPVLFGLPGLARAQATLAYDPPGLVETVTYEEEETVEPTSSARPARALGSFGPFHVSSPDRVDMDGVIDSSSPADFAALLALHPGIKTLVMHDCPGSQDDDANLALARMVHKAGIDTVLPADGSIRSGAVELFLAGKHRRAAPGAEIGVHSWIDDEGHQATDFAATAPVHNAYIRYYVDMGMPPDQAHAFYDFTNHAAPASGVHYMTSAEVRRFGLLTDS